MDQYIATEVASLAVALSTGLQPAGQKVTVNGTGQVIHFNGALIDPIVLTLTVTDGAGHPTLYTYGSSLNVTRDSLGVYYASIPLTMAGLGAQQSVLWQYTWVGDPNTIVAKPGWGSFTVVTPPS